MGNCVFKGFGEEEEEVVKVVTSNGGMMELLGPITVNCITKEFPGHAIYRRREIGFSHSHQPLLHTEELQPGELYHLLPLYANAAAEPMMSMNMNMNGSVLTTPYRMSCGGNQMRKRAESEYCVAEPEVVPRYNRCGVWKVKLVISPQHLCEILSHESRTEELIESVRTVAKCGSSASSLAAPSDHLSVSGCSWKGSSYSS